MHCPRSAPVSEPEADWGKGGNPQSMTISPLRVSSFTSSNLCSVPTTVRKGPGRKQRCQLLPFYRDLEVSLQSELSYPWTRIEIPGWEGGGEQDEDRRSPATVAHAWTRARLPFSWGPVSGARVTLDCPSEMKLPCVLTHCWGSTWHLGLNIHIGKGSNLSSIANYMTVQRIQ